jgi:Kef-type K+ transport system membrane component KefB
MHLKRLKFPLISGYLLSGILIGPFVFKFMDTSEVKELSFITDFALATIAFCAGSELYFPEIRNLFRTIAINISMIVLMSFVIMPPVVYIIAPAIPFLADFSGVCLANVSVLVGCLMLERSASSALGVISELKAKGVLTKTFLGITVVSDVVLLVLYAITSTFAEAACTDLGFNGKTIVSLVISFSVCFVSGVMLGFLLIFYLWIPKIPSALRGALILPTGYIHF